MTRCFRLGVGSVLKHRSKSYVSAGFFLDSINSILTPYLNERRQSEEFAGCEPVLSMDHCSPHTGDAIIELLTGQHVRETMVEVNICGVFSAIGFSYDITQKPYELLFDKQEFRQSRDFLELWERDLPFESLSRQRQQARFGWISQPE
jgi:hypothetical protein